MLRTSCDPWDAFIVLVTHTVNALLAGAGAPVVYSRKIVML